MLANAAPRGLFKLQKQFLAQRSLICFKSYLATLLPLKYPPHWLCWGQLMAREPGCLMGTMMAHWKISATLLLAVWFYCWVKVRLALPWRQGPRQTCGHQDSASEPHVHFKIREHGFPPCINAYTKNMWMYILTTLYKDLNLFINKY